MPPTVILSETKNLCHISVIQILRCTIFRSE